MCQQEDGQKDTGLARTIQLHGSYRRELQQVKNNSTKCAQGLSKIRTASIHWDLAVSKMSGTLRGDKHQSDGREHCGEAEKSMGRKQVEKLLHRI